MKIRNKIELKLLGYTVFSDKQNWKKTIQRLIWHYLIYPFNKTFKFGLCEKCNKLTRLEYLPYDAEPNDEGGVDVFKAFICEDCENELSVYSY